jgi:ADP-heptose:LPS heptosyltransferase
MKEKYFIWHIQGGLGKNIAGTALINTIKKTYPDRKLIMVTSWAEVYLNNPDVDRVYILGQTPHFYEDYIENKDVIISMHEPYHQTSHITKQKHLIENWCDLMGLKYNNQTPIIIPNYSQGILLNLWQRPKPIMVIQTGGGPMEGQKYHYSWTRDMPSETAQEIVNQFSNQYHIIQVTRPNGYELQGVERLDTPLSNMELFSLLVVAQKRVLIDSSLQHAAAALNLPSTVLWVGTSHKVFGYTIHNNIQANLPNRANQLISSYMFDYSFENNMHECPYINVTDIFNINNILKNI